MSETTYRIRIPVLRAVESELQYQQKRWPEHTHTVAEWLAIIEKKLNDAKLAWYTGHGDDSVAMQEIRQVTACGFAAMDQCGAIPRE